MCGEVNGKNGFGAYSGSHRFVVEIIGGRLLAGSVHIDPADGSETAKLFNDALWNVMCI